MERPEFTLAELVGYEDVEARSHEALASLVVHKDIKYEEVQKRYKEELHLDTEDSLHYGALQFVLYMLDAKGIVEHGGGISSCWLTKLGKMYLTVLNAWHDREEKEKKENEVVV